MEFMSSDSIIYVRSSSNFKITWKKECTERNTTFAWENILYQHKKCIILPELALWNRQEVYETGKKRESFLLEQPYRHY